jgi:hypothetical protein
VEGAADESVKHDGGTAAEAGPAMLDPGWTREKGYSHALALMSRIEHCERSLPAPA